MASDAPPIGSTRDIKAWSARWKKVGTRTLGQTPLAPGASLAQSLALIDLVIDRVRWPVAEDAVRRREVEEARSAWAKLRARPPG